MSSIFTKDSNVSRATVKRHFLKLVPYRCAECGNNGVYNKKKLSLQLDHINGVRNDNRKENLRLLCPNCHSQQKTTNRQKNKPKRNKVVVNDKDVLRLAQSSSSIRQILLELGVLDSGVNYEKVRHILRINNASLANKGLSIQYRADRNRPRPQAEKISWPDDRQLHDMVWSEPMIKLADRLGVSDVAIKKRCDKRKISTPPMGHWLIK